MNTKTLLRKQTETMGLVLGTLSMALVIGCTKAKETTTLNDLPPQSETPPLVRTDYAPGALTQVCDAAIAETRTRLDAIANVPALERNFDNTVLAFERVVAEFSDKTGPTYFMGYVAPNASVRAEGSDCEQKVGQFGVEINTRKDLYVALKDQTPRNADEARLISETLKSFESNGLKLSDEDLAKVKDLKTQLSTLEAKFSENLNNDTASIELAPEELAGLSADFMSTLEKTADGKRYVVGTNEGTYGAFLNNASNAEARRKWLFSYYNRQGTVNTALLEQAIGLRQQIAKLMGYSTWADYRIHGRMAKDAQTVNTFLGNLKGKLASRNAADMAKLLKFKQESDPTATKVEAWDINYLAYQLKKRDYTLDGEKIREYFPSEGVVSGMFDVYSQLLGVQYKQVTDGNVWNPDVKLYRIENKKDGRLLGFFYADLIPRTGKYGHAAAFPLISGRVIGDRYSVPVASIVANLTPPQNGKPSLLSHEDVVTLFHEFGHIMHQTLTRARYASLSGSATAQDFVEAPSQMLENWPWDAEILNKISGHYLDRNIKLPADLLSKMIEARDFNKGYYYTRQLMLATLDMTYHSTDGPVDTAAVYNQLYKDMIGVDPVADAHFSASFGHLMGGYDAGYYGYLWSEVYAADMFTRFQAEGLLSPVTGGDYRKMILEQGNMVDALDILKQFLGREPSPDAFFKKLGI